MWETMEAPFRCLDEFDVFMVSNCLLRDQCLNRSGDSLFFFKSFSLFVLYLAYLSEVGPNRTLNTLDFQGDKKYAGNRVSLMSFFQMRKYKVEIKTKITTRIDGQLNHVLLSKDSPHLVSGMMITVVPGLVMGACLIKNQTTTAKIKTKSNFC